MPATLTALSMQRTKTKIIFQTLIPMFRFVHYSFMPYRVSIALSKFYKFNFFAGSSPKLRHYDLKSKYQWALSIVFLSIEVQMKILKIEYSLCIPASQAFFPPILRILMQIKWKSCSFDYLNFCRKIFVHYFGLRSIFNIAENARPKIVRECLWWWTPAFRNDSFSFLLQSLLVFSWLSYDVVVYALRQMISWLAGWRWWCRRN